MIREVVVGRVRHRALLDLLVKGEFSWNAYLDRYTEFYERDAEPLFAQIILKADDFKAAFGDWKTIDMSRYGVAASREPDDIEAAANDPDAADVRPQKRRRKSSK